MNDKDLTLDGKIDKILKYQMRMYRMQLIKSIIGFVLFFVLVVLPIIWFAYWIKTIDFTIYTDALESLQGASGGLDRVNEILDGLKP